MTYQVCANIAIINGKHAMASMRWLATKEKHGIADSILFV